MTNIKNNFFYKVEIIRSNKRKKTISARFAEDVMSIYAPADIPDSELEKSIDKLKKRLYKRKFKRELDKTPPLKELGGSIPVDKTPPLKELGGSIPVDKTQGLTTIAERLNKKYFDNRLKITSIKYTTNQNRIFGYCNYKVRKIRISHRLMQMPYWVRDYVIIHEMAHLIEPNHSRAFWDIVYQYKLTERSKGYLMAQGLNLEEEPDDIK